MHRTSSKSRLCCFVLMALAAGGWSSPGQTNPESSALNDFEHRVGAYMQLRKRADSVVGHLRPKANAEAIAAHERELAARISSLRPDAHQGDIFTQPITAAFRHIVLQVLRGRSGPATRHTLRSAAPVTIAAHVNGPYPAGVPLQTMPISLLDRFPRLPKDLEYRIIGSDLILRDIGANLIVDIAPGVMETQE